MRLRSPARSPSKRSKPAAMTVRRTSSPSASSMTAPKMMLASGWAAWPMISAASLTSNRPRSDGPDTFRRMPRAPSMLASSNGLEIAARAAVTDRPSPDEYPMPMSAEPASFMIIFTSAKSVLMRPGVVMRSVMPCTPCSRTSSAILNAFSIEVLLVGHLEQPVVRDDDEGVDLVLQRLDAVLGLHRAPPALELERPGHDADGERADVCGRSRRRRARRRCRCRRPRPR